MATIVHFDIGADNPERAKKFYETLFGWKVELLPGPMNYYLIETTDLNNERGIGGGMEKRERPEQTGITNFIGVSSIDKISEKIIQLGGKIVQPKQAISGYGFIAVCLDTENNRFGLFQEE